MPPRNLPRLVKQRSAGMLPLHWRFKNTDWNSAIWLGCVTFTKLAFFLRWRGFSINAQAFIQSCKVKKLPKKMTRWLYLTDKKHVVGESFDQLDLRIVGKEVESRSNYVKIDIERVDSRSGSNSWAQLHHVTSILFTNIVVFSSVQFHCVVVALIPSFLFLPWFSFENHYAICM